MVSTVLDFLINAVSEEALCLDLSDINGGQEWKYLLHLRRDTLQKLTFSNFLVLWHLETLVISYACFIIFFILFYWKLKS